MAQNGSVSDEKGPISPTVSGTTAASYDEEATQKVVRDRPLWAIWRSPRGSSNKQHPTSSRVLTRPLEQSPKGYAMVANFQCSDRNFLHYRGFLNLHSRLLSDLQFDIECLEKELEQLDQWDLDSKDPLRELCLQCKDHDRRESTYEEMPETFKDEFKRTRPEVLKELHSKLMKYDEVLLKSKEVNALQRPSNRDHRSVLRWFDSKKPLVAEEAEYIRRKEDLVTLRSGRECGGFDGLVEQCLSAADRGCEKLHCDLIKKLFVSPELREKTSDKRIHYYSPARVDILVNIVITTIIFVLLIIPVVVLYKLSSVEGGPGPSPFEAIGILIIFTLLFGGAMSSLTTATRQELFAASAAYCAVLVVFISNFTTQNVTSDRPLAVRIAPG